MREAQALALGNREVGNRVMKNISVIGATLVAAAVLCAAPISLHQSQDKGLSLSVDKALARIGRPLTPGSVAGVHRRYERRAYRGGYYGHGNYGQGYYGHGGSQAGAAAPLTCKEAAKLQFPTDRKTRRAYRNECKQAWKAQKAPKA
jgi:hypothetical protein